MVCQNTSCEILTLHPIKNEIMMKYLYYLSLALFCIACSPKAPTDEQLEDLCRNAAFAINNLKEGDKGKAFQEVVTKNAQNYDIQKISPSQVELLFDAGGVSLDSTSKVPEPHIGSIKSVSPRQPVIRIIPAASTSLSGASTDSWR